MHGTKGKSPVYGFYFNNLLASCSQFVCINVLKYFSRKKLLRGNAVLCIQVQPESHADETVETVTCL